MTTTIAFAGEAEVAVAQVVPGGLQLQLESSGEAFEIVQSHTTYPLPCGKVHTQDYNAVAAGTGLLKLNLSAIFAGTNLVFLSLFPEGEIKLSRGYASYVDELPSCDPEGKSRVLEAGALHTSERTPAAVTWFCPPFESPPFGNTDEIVGTYRTMTVSSGIPVDTTWIFNLKRKK